MFGQKGGSRTDTLIKLVLIFFISLLSFSVGTFVGKQFSDSQHKLSQLESEYEGGATRETASVPSDSLDVKPEDALTDKDIQQIADEFTKPEAVGEAKNAADSHAITHGEAIGESPRKVAATGTLEEPAHGEAKKVDALGTEHAAQRVAHDKAPTELKPEKKNPLATAFPSGVAASSIGKYTVQISSHQSETEAKDEAGKLRAKGFSAFVVPATVKGKNWYRVSVGLFDKKDEAKTYRERLLKEAGVASAFIQQIVK